MTQGGQDTPARLLDSSGAVLESYEYDAYGAAVTLPSATENNPYRWKGMRVDPETGLGYRRNRYYSFSLGRFLTHDPLGLWADGFNWGNGYAYVGNGPGTRGDALGLQGGLIITGDPGMPAAMASYFDKALNDPVSGMIPNALGIYDSITGRIERARAKFWFFDVCAEVAILLLEEAGGTVGAVVFTASELGAGNIVAALGNAVSAVPGIPGYERLVKIAGKLKLAIKGDKCSVVASAIEPSRLGSVVTRGADDLEAVVGAAKPGKPFALGLDEHLDEFAAHHGAETWKVFPDPSKWREGVLGKLEDPDTPVLFNLQGVDAWEGATRAAGGRGGHGLGVAPGSAERFPQPGILERNCADWAPVPMSRVIHEFDPPRDFQFWEFRVSHGSLLLRSPATGGLKQWDIVFTGVLRVSVTRHLTQVTGLFEDAGGVGSGAARCFVVVHASERSQIVAAKCWARESSLGLFESPFE